MGMLHYACLAAVAGLLMFSADAHGATIAFFNDGTYVDTTREGPNLRATLVGLGHSVMDFSGITDVAFAAALAGVDIVVFPEMEIRNLNPDLSAAARGVLSGFVAGGGGMIQANYFLDNSSLPNALFGYSLSQQGSIGSTDLAAAAAAGTPFTGGPATLPGSDAVEGVLRTSLPVGALDIYHNATQTSLFATTLGSGRYVYLGFDWFEEPTPAAWIDVTGRAVAHAAARVAEPTTAVLLLLGLGTLAVRRRVK